MRRRWQVRQRQARLVQERPAQLVLVREPLVRVQAHSVLERSALAPELDLAQERWERAPV